MNIDWKARILSKTWWITIIGAVILLLQQVGLFELANYIPQNYADIINTIFLILTLFGITVDTSTPGISDSNISAVTAKELIKAANTINKVQTESTTTSVNNKINQNSNK